MRSVPRTFSANLPSNIKQGNPRTTGILVAAKENNLDIELVRTHPGEGISDDYRKINKLGRIPTFEGADGYILSEMLAIAVYCTSLVICLMRTRSYDETYYQYSYPWQKHPVDLSIHTLTQI